MSVNSLTAIQAMTDARIAVARPRVPKEDDGSTLSWEEFITSYRVTIIRGYFRFRLV